MQKSLNASPGFLLRYGGEGGGVIRCAHPTGSLRLSKTQCVLSNPVEGSHRSLLRNIKQKSLNASPGFLLKYGGEGGG
ncbi:Uncharacterised protein [Serratia odorifera]|uniref:Uncharacterized protein n=1 Tax=Serratia odorifera TaxID=618 RepID=A0A3S4EFN3_SEROD|nr:Uncharacterised protein [Serratia odorifera]